MREYRQRASTWVLLADVRMNERRRQGLSARKVELYRQWLEDGRGAKKRAVRNQLGFESVIKARRGPERLGYLMAREGSGPCGSTPRTRPHATTATQRPKVQALSGANLDTT